MANRKNKKLRMANANSNRGEINVGNLEQSNTHHTRVEDQQYQITNSQNQGSDEGSRHEAQEDKGRIYEYVARLLYPNALEKWILKSIGLKWKDYKCYLKGKYYNDDIDINIVQDRCPSDVEKDQWISLVNFWRSEEGKKRSKRGKESLMNAKVKSISTTGTKSHARVREELNQIKSIIAEQGDTEMNLGDDPVSKVLGKDQYDRVRGLGLGAKPSNFVEISAPPYCTGLNLSSKDERVVFYHLRQLKGWKQRLNKRVKRQDTPIKKLKSKLQSQFGSDFDDSDSNNSDSASSDFDEDGDFNIHGVDKVRLLMCYLLICWNYMLLTLSKLMFWLYGLIYSACGFVA
ncbi:hypothetical protein RDABS01_027354 [Bienertia sinuspersici]